MTDNKKITLQKEIYIAIVYETYKKQLKDFPDPFSSKILSTSQGYD